MFYTINYRCVYVNTYTYPYIHFIHLMQYFTKCLFSKSITHTALFDIQALRVTCLMHIRKVDLFSCYVKWKLTFLWVAWECIYLILSFLATIGLSLLILSPLIGACIYFGQRHLLTKAIKSCKVSMYATVEFDDFNSVYAGSSYAFSTFITFLVWFEKFCCRSPSNTFERLWWYCTIISQLLSKL